MQADLIIMANRGASNQGRWPIGNVAAGVVRSSDCPVLLVRKPVNEAELANRRLINKILLPLDGSELSEAALPVAERISQEMEAQVVLFRAVEPYERLGTVSPPGISYITAQKADATTKVTSVLPIIQYMNAIKQSLAKKGINSVEAIQEGLAAEEIVSYAEANDIDLIVMSTHGRSGIGRWAFGSVTDRVLHTGDIPVLVVYP
jgi:nucleotide-binding universal stress UspA family protein